MVKKDVVELKVLNLQGKAVDSLELAADVFAGPVLPHLVHETVVWQLAKRRAGTHATLTKREVSGGGKKPWAQKGTGRARAGSNTSPLWVGGGVSHGPQPRSYNFRLPKRTRRQALISVLSEKAKTNKLVVFEDMHIKSGKTKDFVKVLQAAGVGKGAVLLISDKNEKTQAATDSLQKVSRNVAKVVPLNTSAVNVYDLMRSEYLVGSKSAFLELQSRVLGTSKELN